MIRKLMNRLVVRYYNALAVKYFMRMTRQRTMKTFQMKDDVGGIGVVSFTNKENLRKLIEVMQEALEDEKW